MHGPSGRVADGPRPGWLRDGPAQLDPPRKGTADVQLFRNFQDDAEDTH
jgi:hypothetical protein